MLELVDEGVVDLEAATVRIAFDPLFLSLTGVANGDVTSGFSLTLGPPSGGSPDEILVSLASLLGPVTGVSGSLLVAHFDIRASAPFGQTAVSFQSADTDYDIPATFGTVSVVQGAVPAVGSVPLLALGLTCLVAASVRRRAALKAISMVKAVSMFPVARWADLLPDAAPSFPGAALIRG